MDNLAIEEFRRDFMIKTLVQEAQFELWIKYFFFLNNKLIEKYDLIYQDAFYTKFYELFTEGLIYASKVLDALRQSDNNERDYNKRDWYLKLIEGLNNVRIELTDEEFEYIQYRRHSACHIFQNSYELIRDNLRIKKERNGRDLQEIQRDLQGLILKHGSDTKIDYHINEKVQKMLTILYQQLT